jgi:hypothetical protein
MRLAIPFFRQTSKLNCGVAALRMVLAYFGKCYEAKVLEARIGIKEGKGISTIQIEIAAASLGYRADFYSKHILFRKENMKHEFYQKYRDIDLEKSKKLLEDAKSAGVNIQEKALSLKEILESVTKDSVPIVLIDRNVVKARRENGYQGHFVPIVGFDEKNVYIHNSELDDSQEFVLVQKRTFDEARKAEGTDEDVVIIHRKQLD